MTNLPSSWVRAPFGSVWTAAQNGCGARTGTGTSTVVLRLADVDVEGRVATSGLREVGLSADDRAKYALSPGDLLVFRVNGSPQIAGRVIAYSGPAGFAFCDHFIRIRLPDDGAVPGFVARAVSQGDARSAVERGMVSTAGQNTVSQATLAEILIPIAPRNEQQRIVEALDSYLSRLDSAIASLQKVQTKLKAYRASVLKAAVEGRLVPTEAEIARREGRDYEPASVLLARILKERRHRWEEAELARMKKAGKTPKDDAWKKKYEEPEAPDTSKLPSLPEGWCWTTIAEVSDCLDSMRVPINKAERLGRQGTVPYYGANGQVGWIDTPLFDEPLVLVVEDETFTGRTKPFSYLINGPAWVNNHAHVLRATDAILPSFLNVALSFYPFTPLTTGTTGRRKLTQRAMNGAPIALPPLSEQQRIVDLVDMHVSEMDSAEETAVVSERRCARLRQSVLKWAFEGKLVDQDPNDEPAEELLARIRAERAAAPTTKTRGRKAKSS